MKKILAISMSLMMFVPVSSQEIDLDEPTVLPDSPFYGLKKAFEQLTLRLTFDKEAKAQRLIDISNNRLAEANAMAERNESVNDLVAESQEKLDEAEKITEENNLTDVEETVIDARNKHIVVLNEIHGKVPEDAKFGIETAMAAAVSENRKEIEEINKSGSDRAENLSNELDINTNDIRSRIENKVRINIGSVSDRAKSSDNRVVPEPFGNKDGDSNNLTDGDKNRPVSKNLSEKIGESGSGNPTGKVVRSVLPAKINR